MLPLVRRDAVSGEARLIKYSDDDSVREISDTPCDLSRYVIIQKTGYGVLVLLKFA